MAPKRPEVGRPGVENRSFLHSFSCLMKVLAVDVGHGHTKSASRPVPDVLRRDIFPSFALPSPSGSEGARQLSSSHGGNVLTVEADDSLFLVGKGVEDHVKPTDARNLQASYSLSAPYLALTRGALHYAGYETVDILVVGLPLTTFHSNTERLRARLQGIHPVPAFKTNDGRTETTEVDVKRVVVLPQPIGALTSALMAYPHLSKARILTLDIGYFTMDALTSVGIRPLTGRSGAVPGGVSSYLEAVQKSLGEAISKVDPSASGTNAVPTWLVEDAIRTNADRISLYCGDFPLHEHIASAQERMTQDLLQAINIIGGSITDLNAFVLAGGGAPLLAPILKKQFPGIRSITVAEDPQFSIARGYLSYGERLARQEMNNA